jgi:hypothetical protein
MFTSSFLFCLYSFPYPENEAQNGFQCTCIAHKYSHSGIAGGGGGVSCNASGLKSVKSKITSFPNPMYSVSELLVGGGGRHDSDLPFVGLLGCKH